jgi:hypothetical protein
VGNPWRTIRRERENCFRDNKEGMNPPRKESNMKTRLCWLLILTGWMTAGCQSIRVQTEYDHSVAFSGLRTFCWVAPPSWLHNDPRLHMDLVEPLVRRDVESQLQARGFQPTTDCAKADFQVTFTGGLQDKFTETSGTSRVAVYQYNADTGGEWFTSTSGGTLTEKRVPSLVIENRQPRSNRVLWQGVASANLPRAVNDAQIQQRVQTAVDRILKGFPPPASK